MMVNPIWSRSRNPAPKSSAVSFTMKITRCPDLPRGFVYSADHRAALHLNPTKVERGELYLPTADGVMIVEAEISEIKDWAAAVGGDLPTVIAALIEGVSHPCRSFAGLFAFGTRGDGGRECYARQLP